MTALSVPSGMMVGAMLFTAMISLMGAKVVAPTVNVFKFLLVGVGISLSDKITPDTLVTLQSGNLLLMVLVSNFLIFLTSFMVSYVIHRITDYDYATSFMAAAPSGFTVMSILAAKYDKKPFEVSILHLCRLVLLRLLIPLVFMIGR